MHNAVNHAEKSSGLEPRNSYSWLPFLKKDCCTGLSPHCQCYTLLTTYRWESVKKGIARQRTWNAIRTLKRFEGPWVGPRGFALKWLEIASTSNQDTIFFLGEAPQAPRYSTVSRSRNPSVSATEFIMSVNI